jgi:hypothetical protein
MAFSSKKSAGNCQIWFKDMEYSDLGLESSDLRMNFFIIF